LAVLMRLLRIPIKIRRYNKKSTQEKLDKYEQLKKLNSKALTHSVDSQTGLKFNLSQKNLAVAKSQLLHRSILTSDTESEKSLDLTNPADYDESDRCSEMSSSTVRDQDIDDDDDDDGILDPGRYQKSISSYMSVLSLDKTKPKTYDASYFRSTNRITACHNSLIEYLSHPKYVLPKEVDTGKPLRIVLSEFVECGHFWAQIDDEAHQKTLVFIHESLNNSAAKANRVRLDQSELRVDTLCAAFYEDAKIAKSLYRARIIDVDTRVCKALVQFVDFGNKLLVDTNDLFGLSENMQEYPFQAIECKLYNIKPCLIKNPNGVWTKKSNDFFNQLIDEKYAALKWEIVSLDETVVLGNLIAVNLQTGDDEKVADTLLNNDYASRLNDVELSMCKNKPMFTPQNFFYVPSRESDFLSKQPRYNNFDSNARKLMEKKMTHQTTGQARRGPLRDDRGDDQDEDDDDDNKTVCGEDDDYDMGENNRYADLIDIRGPYSPLEIKYYSIVNVGTRRKVRVERESINYVTLDDDPTNEANRLMVAVDVNLNESGEAMILRKTCLLPKLPGLSSICCVLFAPTAEMRLDDMRTCYTGALCGLGYDKQQEAPIYTDNDIECSFDVKIDDKDLKFVGFLVVAWFLLVTVNSCERLQPKNMMFRF
jgi:hypothetical protein